MSKLLSRDEFREAVFTRDNHTCVIPGCNRSIKNGDALDAHHILERRLWNDGGYYLDNGVTLCDPEHHMQAEMTLISPNYLRELTGISKIILPDHLYADCNYTKWGDILFPDDTRSPGELFHDESVQKVLSKGSVLDLYKHYIKYPRTMHFDFSPGVTEDDRIIKSLDKFIGERVVVMEKMDGENSNLYSDYFHARSIDGNSHPSRNWLKMFHAKIQGDIPPNWRICGENLYARHSIHYNNLESYFYGFSIWNEKNICLSWNDTIEWFNLLGIIPVPILYDGIWDEKLIKSLHKPMRNGNESEGYVVRVAREFHFSEFKTVVGKFVRKDHVNENAHSWKRNWQPNDLKS